MKKTKEDAIIKLTQEILERYWQHDYQCALSYMTEDVVWIGCTRDQCMRGLEAVSRDYASVDRELKKCHLSMQEYEVVQNAGRSCSIAGRYLVTTDPDTDVFLQVQQRCLFVWEEIEGQFRIRGLHISNPMGEVQLEAGEQFPNHLGHQSYQYLMDNIRRTEHNRKFMVTDIQGVTHFIFEGEIESVEAEQHAIRIQLANDEIRVNLSISCFLADHPDIFVRVHRSYAVNPVYISHIEKSQIIMDSGRHVLMPAKKKKEICALLGEKLKK